MIAAWKEPSVEGVKTFMSSVVVDRVNENDKVAAAINVVVLRIRGACGRANTVSDNENEVPPEGLQHALVLATTILLAGSPNFGFMLKGPDGAESGFGYMVRAAEKWVIDVQNGMAVTRPVNAGGATAASDVIRYGGEDIIDTTSA